MTAIRGIGRQQFFLLFGPLCLVACDQSAVSPTPAVKATPVHPPTSAFDEAASGRRRPPVSQSAIDAASEAIWAEPAVLDFNYRPDNVVQWIVAVEDDGSPRYGYAEYICLLLSEHGARGDETVVRITDIEAQRTYGEDFNSASLGSVRCRDQARFDDAPAVG